MRTPDRLPQDAQVEQTLEEINAEALAYFQGKVDIVMQYATEHLTSLLELSIRFGLEKELAALKEILQAEPVSLEYYGNYLINLLRASRKKTIEECVPFNAAMTALNDQPKKQEDFHTEADVRIHRIGILFDSMQRMLLEKTATN